MVCLYFDTGLFSGDLILPVSVLLVLNEYKGSFIR